MSEPIILARAIHIAATVLAAGTVCFLVLVAEPALRAAGDAAHLSILRRRCNLIVWSALAVTALSGVGWLALLAADIYGDSVVAVCLHGGLWPVLTGTRFGTVWSVRLADAVMLAAMLAWPAARYLQLAAGALLLGSLAFIGHAGATPGTAGDVHLASDVVHLIAAGAWLGGLPALALMMLTVKAAPECARATARFSALGIVCVGALAVSGLINSWNLLGSPLDLITTDYGRLLSLKLGLFAAMLGIAAVNRFHLTPRLASAPARQALARNSIAECVFGLGVLLAVAALGTMPPTAHTILPPVDIPPDAAFVHIHTEEVMADVSIDPGRPGPANASIRVLREDLSEFPASDLNLTLAPPSADAQLLTRAAARQSDGTWQVNGLNIGQPGNWTVQITIGRQSKLPIVLDAPIVIERK